MQKLKSLLLIQLKLRNIINYKSGLDKLTKYLASL